MNTSTRRRLTPPAKPAPSAAFSLEQLQGLRAFSAAAQYLSFTRAAAELEVSPQAVAGAVARLEAALGVRLLNRSTRSMALTEEGARLFPLARQALQQLQEAVQVATHGHTPSGVVRLSAGGGFARRYVLPALPALAARHPEVQIELSMEDRRVDMVREGFDIVIRGGVLGDASVISRRIAPIRSVLVASAAYLKKAGVPRKPAELTGHRLIGLRFLSGVNDHWSFEQRGAPATVEPQCGLTLFDPESVVQAAALGLGVGAVSIHHALPDLRQGRLKIVLLDSFRPPRREMALQYPHREHLAPRVRVVIEHLMAAFENNPDLHVTEQDLRAFVA